MKASGFTILESLLAIVIMLLVISMTISVIEKQKFNARASKESQEIIDLLNMGSRNSGPTTKHQKLKRETSKEDNLVILRDTKGKIKAFCYDEAVKAKD